MTIPERGDNLMYDSLIFLGTAVTAFGLGWQLENWLLNDTYLAPVFYTTILLVVYVRWILKAHR